MYVTVGLRNTIKFYKNISCYSYLYSFEFIDSNFHKTNEPETTKPKRKQSTNAIYTTLK